MDEDVVMEEPDAQVKEEITTPTVMTPSESAVVVPDLTADSLMEGESDNLDEKDVDQKESEIKKEPASSIPALSSGRPTLQDDHHPSPKSHPASPESTNSMQLDRQMTPEPRTPGSTPGGSAETSPSRKLKRMLPPPERMVTRGVSGAIRHRSVDEILGTALERSPTTPGARYDRSSPGATSPTTAHGTAINASSPSSASDTLNAAINATPLTTASTSTSTSTTASTTSTATGSASVAVPSVPTSSIVIANGQAVTSMPLPASAPKPFFKKHAQPTTIPVMMKRSESRYGSSRFDAIEGMSPSGRSHSQRHVDLYAWQLKAQSQPIYKALQTASKVLTTKDWKVAREELKLMRAMQRIEALKAGNRLSFKQIKKHRGPARTKTHWDHLLDEMRWNQVDFKEERRWKIATAYQVSRWVMAWHEAEDKSTVCIQVSVLVSLSTTTTLVQLIYRL